MYYYIDYENVSSVGLTGIEKLTERDVVRIYYSGTPHVDMQQVETMLAAKAKIQFIRIPDTIKQMKNALDIILMMDIVKIQAHFSVDYAHIISKDKGYDPVVQELNQMVGAAHIFRSESIGEAAGAACPAAKPNAAVDQAALAALFNTSLVMFADQKAQIIGIVNQCKTRTEVNNTIIKKLKLNTPDSRTVMTALKPVIKNLPGQ